MKCTFHPEVDALSDCRLCGRALCASCAVEIKGSPYCRECLEKRVEQPVQVPAMAPLPLHRYSPRKAGWLAVVPGLGLFYLQQYFKALTVAMLFVGMCQLADHTHGDAGFLIPIAWIAQMVYTVQEARRLNRAGVPEEVVEPAPAREKDSPVWGVILIVVGTLFLLDQWDLLDFGYLFERFWPVLIIVLGIQMLLRARRENSQSAIS
ncbi:MAG TPA: DUF5668 domain-containing protein [Candidatus Polarisedimenticolia bacterium]|nr:DUF5668 domain-containing protein [Candidatus Polarisedimenticolia bacterium]